MEDKKVNMHLTHERDGHALNVNEFCYRHREAEYILQTTKGVVRIKPGKGATPEGRRAMVDRPEAMLAKVLSYEGEGPCRCEGQRARLKGSRQVATITGPLFTEEAKQAAA